MACFHPLKAFPIGKTNSGKVKYKIVSYGTHHLEMRSDVWYPISSDFVSPYAQHVVLNCIEIPCGKCIGCRLEYSRQWANRCMLELQYHDSAYFVTLTYDDFHVPVSYYPDPETGEALPSLTLRKRDFQLFMKRLRKAHPDDNIRFFMSGEYGSETFRPHYHAIIFGLHLNDLKPYKRGPNGFTYYMSPSLQLVWSVPPVCKGSITPLTSTLIQFYGSDIFSAAGREPIGMAVLSEVTWETCAYTARYVMKKLSGAESELYSDLSLEVPFSLMSRKPGIARQWYDEHPDYHDYEYINISTPTGGRKFRPPKYYDRLYDIECPEESAKLREVRRRQAKAARELKLSQTDLNYEQLLEVMESNLDARLHGLVRPLD